MSTKPGEGHIISRDSALIYGCLLALAAIAGAVSPTANATDKPNVLFIVVDDLNDWVGVLNGHTQSVTPNIDRLAQRGVLFANAHCAAPACNPSRVAVMTGVRPSTSGVYYNDQPWRQSDVLKDAITLPQHFKKHGYYTLGSGKIYHEPFNDPAGWNEFAPSLQRQTFPGVGNALRNINGLDKDHFDWGPLNEATDEQTPDYKTVEYVIARLNEQRDRPFFLACGIFRPHLPWYVPREYFDAHPLNEILVPDVPDDDLSDVPPAGVELALWMGDHDTVIQHRQWQHAVQGYLASIAFTDMLIGRLLDALDRSPHRNNTIVVVWSDHGWHLGEKHHWRKFTLWEEATRVLLAIDAPGVTRASQRCDRAVNLIDIYPTLVELCGLPPRSELEGTSLVPLLRHPATTWARPSITTYGFKNHAVRSDRYRYIRYADGSEELYDHAVDPEELRNLAADPAFTDIKAQHADLLPKVDMPPSPRALSRAFKVTLVVASVVLCVLWTTHRYRRR